MSVRVPLTLIVPYITPRVVTLQWSKIDGIISQKLCLTTCYPPDCEPEKQIWNHIFKTQRLILPAGLITIPTCWTDFKVIVLAGGSQGFSYLIEGVLMKKSWCGRHHDYFIHSTNSPLSKGVNSTEKNRAACRQELQVYSGFIVRHLCICCWLYFCFGR